jgi:putative flavoprotein involved in K+ transport
MDLLRKLAAERGIALPDIEEPGRFDARAPESLDLSGFGAAIFTAGFRPDYRSWLSWPEAFDESGFPLQRDGASTEAIFTASPLPISFIAERILSRGDAGP